MDALRRIGADWVRRRESAVLAVPGAVIPIPSDRQTIASSLLTLLLYGGADAAEEPAKGVVVRNATDAGKTRRDPMLAEPDAYPRGPGG